MTRSAAAAVAGFLLCLTPPPADGAERKASPSTLERVFAAARGGDTILLAAGDYGTFRGGLKSRRVTLRPRRGADVRMALAFRPAANLTVAGVTLSEVEIGASRSRNLTVRNSVIPGQVTLRTSELQSANILFSRNLHRDWDKCDGCAEGRVWLPGTTARPSGITIRRSEFRGGLSDGIQNGSKGTRIIGNEFHRLETGSADGVHADAIQLYGSSRTVIRGNWFHDLPEGVGNILAADGADHELIEDNVFQPMRTGGRTRPFAIDLFSDDGSVIRHNTLADGACEFNLRCGIIALGSKEGDDPGRGTVIRDNVLGEISCCDGPAAYTSSHNLIRARRRGARDIKGKPRYVGGARPSSYRGFALARRSRGRGDASDGRDRGARVKRYAPAAASGEPGASFGVQILLGLRALLGSGVS
jgi:Right handed beta helix region